MAKIIVTVSLTGGVQSKKETAYLPEQPDEIAADAYACYNEGASVAHIHARDKEGKPSGDPAIFKAIHGAIRSKCNGPSGQHRRRPEAHFRAEACMP